MRGWIIGMGEVGRALRDVLSPVHDIRTFDEAHLTPLQMWPEYVDVLHICFPYSDRFEQEVNKYREHFNPRYTVIHSTVPVGTTKKLNCFYSPVRGVHPHLADSMRQFATYIGPLGEDLECPVRLHFYFTAAEMDMVWDRNTDNLEAGKLWSLAAYAWNIVLEKEIHRYCEKAGLSFDVVYSHFTNTYNQGFKRMGMERVHRPVLTHMPGPIGGHCVIPAVEKLEDGTIEGLVANFILKYNDWIAEHDTS